MAEISYNQIFDGVSLALHLAFPAAHVHGSTVEQGLHPGDFTVLPVSTEHAAQVGSRARRGVTLDVMYYPTETGRRDECLTIADLLPGVLGTITTPAGDKVHCLRFEPNIEDDALHCMVAYPHFVYTQTPEDGMGTIIITQQEDLYSGRQEGCGSSSADV